MSWLFCCGGSEASRHHEVSKTLDLSGPVKIEGTSGVGNCEGVEELGANAEEQQLARILRSK